MATRWYVVGYHEDSVADRRPAAPAVGQVEEATPDNVGADVRPRRTQVVRARCGRMEDQAEIAAGDLDVSVIREMPPGRQPVITTV